MDNLNNLRLKYNSYNINYDSENDENYYLNDTLSLNILVIMIICNMILHKYLYQKAYKIDEKNAFNNSYSIISLINYVLISSISVSNFFNEESDLISLTRETRMFGPFSGLTKVAYLYISYEFYSTFISIYLNSWLYCVHHILSVYIVYWLYNINIFRYYVLYFSGVSAISTVFLCGIDIFHNNLQIKDNFSNLYQLNKFVFMIAFIYFRLIMWSYYIYNSFLDIYKMIDYHDSKISIDNTMTYEIAFKIYGIMTLISIMQYYWGFKICKKAIRFFKQKLN